MDESSPGKDTANSVSDALMEKEKFTKMQAYLPLLEMMINMLEAKESENHIPPQLIKIRYMKTLILEKKLTTVDSLRKCEGFMRNYWQKLQGQLGEIPDMVFEDKSSQSNSTKKDSLMSYDGSSTSYDCPSLSSEDSKERIYHDSAQSMQKGGMNISPSKQAESPERKRNISILNTVSESRRKNKNPIQKLNQNAIGDSSKSFTKHLIKDSLLSSVEKINLHENKGEKLRIVKSDGHSSRFSESRSLASPMQVSPERMVPDKKSNKSEIDNCPKQSLGVNKSYLCESNLNLSKSTARKDVTCEKEPAKINLHKNEFGKKLDNFLSSSKMTSDNRNTQKSPLNVSSVKEKLESAADTPLNSKTVCPDGSSTSSSTILGNMSEEELKKLVTENLSSLPALPPETKCFLETLKQHSARQASDSVTSPREINPSVGSDFDNAQAVSSENCQKIYQPSTRDPRRHSKDGQVENMVARGGILPTSSPIGNLSPPPLPLHQPNSDTVMSTQNFIPVISQRESFLNRQSFNAHYGKIDNMTNIQPLLPMTSPVEQRNVPLLPHGEQMENVGWVDFLPKSPVENTGKVRTLLPFPVPQFNNMGNKLSPRDPRRCSQDSKPNNVPDVPHQIPNMCVQAPVFRGDCMTQPTAMFNMQPKMPEPLLQRIDYCHGIQPPVPYPPDITHPGRSFPVSNVNPHVPMVTQRQMFHQQHTNNITVPRSMEISGYVRPNLHKVVPTGPTFNNRPVAQNIHAPVSNRPNSNPQENSHNARKKVLNNWMEDPRNASKLPSQMSGRSKYSQSSCKFQRPLNNTFHNSQHKSGDKSSADRRKQDEQRRNSSSEKSSNNDSKKSREHEKDSAKSKNASHSVAKSGAIPNSPAPNKSLYGAIIVSKDGKGKDKPQKFKIPKLKKTESSESTVSVDESKSSCDKGEDDVTHRLEMLFEKKLSDKLKKKLLKVFTSSIGIDLEEIVRDPNKKTENNEVKGKDAGTVSKCEAKELHKKSSSMIKTAERKVKKFVISSSDEDEKEVSVKENTSEKKSVALDQAASKKSELKKQPLVLSSSDSSCDEKTEKSFVGKLSKRVEGKKMKQKISKNKSADPNISKTSDAFGVVKEVKQSNSVESYKDDSIKENIKTALSKLSEETENAVKGTKRVRSSSESSLVNEKLDYAECEIGSASTLKKTKKSKGSVRDTNGDCLTEVPVDSANINVKKSSKDNEKPNKRTSDALEISKSSEELVAKKSKISKTETQVIKKPQEVADDLSQKDSKKMTEKKLLKKSVLDASDSSDDGYERSSSFNEKVALPKKAVSSKITEGKDSSDSSAEESVDSSYSIKTRRKGNVRTTRNSLDSSEGEITGKLPSKILKKKLLVRKKNKTLIDDSSEDERLEEEEKNKLKRNKRMNGRHAEITEKSGLKLRKLEENDSEVSDGVSSVRRSKRSSGSKVSKSVLGSKSNSLIDDDSSGNEMSENNNRAHALLSKHSKKSSLPNSDEDIGESEPDGTRHRIAKKKSKKHVIESESDDSGDYRFSGRSKKLSGKENKTLSENKELKQSKKNARRRNALEMLQDDIRENIGNEVALAFGQRKCTFKSQCDRSDDVVEVEEEKRRVSKKKQTSSRNDSRKLSVSIKNSSEESDSDDCNSEIEKHNLLKCGENITKVKISKGKEYNKFSSKKLRILARRPYKKTSQGIAFSQLNFADSFYFCKNKPGKPKNSRINLQDVIGKLWSRVFKLGMNFQMDSDANDIPNSEEKVNKFENKSIVTHGSEMKLEVKETISISNTDSKTALGIVTVGKVKSNLESSSDSPKAESSAETIEKGNSSEESNKDCSRAESAVVTIDRVNKNVENSAESQDKLPVLKVSKESTSLHNKNENDNCPTEEKEKNLVECESQQDGSVHADQLGEPEEVRDDSVEGESQDGNSCLSTLVDECDDTVSNISVCDDSDASEKGSEISLLEGERLAKKCAPKKSKLGRMTRVKRKKKVSNWQNGVIKKKVKISKPSNELANVCQERAVESPALTKEKSLDEKVDNDDMADPSYTIDGRTKYDCKYCNFSGVKIVPHYKQSHPGKEVCISRISNTLALKAKSESLNDVNEEQDEATENTNVRRLKRTFVCRICHQFSEYIMDFYYHLTTHTGEYDFECDSCSYCSSNISGVRHHSLLRHNGFSRTVALKRGPSHNAKFMYGYLCSVCNFLQLLKENVEKHMALRHQKDESAKIFRINMSIPLEESTKEVTTGNKCSSDTLRIADEQESHNETHSKSIKDVAEDSVNNVSTNMEKPTPGSQSKRITSKNVPASMNPVVVLKGMKRLIKKGRNSSGPKAVDAVTENVSQDEGSVDERNAAGDENAMEGDDIADDASEAEVCENQTDLNDVQKLPSEMTVNQVTTAESSAKSVEVSADSNSNSNESFDAETSSTARAEDFNTAVAETPQHPVDEATSVNSDSAENPGPQEDTNISSQAVESELQDSCVSATVEEGFAPDANRAVTDKDSTEKVGQFLGMDAISPGKTGDKSPERRETVPFKRSSSLLERIEFLCAQSNASEKQIEANPVNKLAKTDSTKAKKKLAENAERSSITTRASTTARKQVSCLENSDVSRVAVENDGALIGYSLSASPVSSAYLESVVPSERNDSDSRDHPRAVTSDNLADNSESATANPPEHDYQAVVSPLLCMDTIAIKQENLEPRDIGTEGSDSGGLELYDITSMPDPSVSSICIGPMEAKNEGGRILFCCRISGCHFQCSQVVKFACHYNTEHDKAWDGFCVLCGEVIDGIAPYCLEQAVEHLLSFHLTSKLKQKNLSSKGKAKMRRPSATQRTNKVVRSSSADSTTASVTTTTACPVVATSTCVTASNVTCPSSSHSTSATAVPATVGSGNGSSFTDTQAVADLLKNAVLIKNEPLDAEEAVARDDEAGVRDDEAGVRDDEARVRDDGDEGRESVRESPVKSPSLQAPDARPRIRVRRISGDRLSMRTEEAQEPPAVPAACPEEVQPKVERTDDGEYEQPADLDKDVSSDVAPKPSSALWPELSPAVCDESVLETSTGRCSPVLWGEGGGEASNSFPSIRIESVVSLNPEANKQDDSAAAADAGPRSPSGGAVTKKPCSRLQVDARLVALSSAPPSAVCPKVKVLARKPPAPPSPSVLKPQPSVSPSRVAVIKPLSSEARRKDAALSGAVAAQKTTTAQRSVKSSKSPDAYRAMLEPARLQRLFKCMHPTCEFATGAEARFVAHARVHERALGPAARARLQDWNRCAYCCEACATARDLVAHVAREHGYCLYQCAYCFFRAMSPTYVLLHQKSSHVREAVAIIIDQRRRKMPELKDFPDKRENRKSVVLPYVCAQGTCGARFYPCDDYLAHLKTVHTQVTIYSCHLCECKSMKPDALLSHYKWHSLYQYQCMYCLHGADSALDMKHHLCTFHSDQPNRAIIRIFQDYMHHSHRQVEDLLTIDLDEGMDYTNLFVQCVDDEEDRGDAPPASDAPPPAPAPAPAKPPKAKRPAPVVINLEGHDLFHCGNKGCIHTAGTSHELRDHLSMCDFARESAVLECAHCGKRLKAIASLVEHLLSHGPERYCCSSCGFKATVSAVVERHCRQLHRYPATRVEPVYTGEANTDSMWFVVRPREKRRVAKGAKGPEKKSYEPKDIHKLPDKDIFKEQVSCSMCSFATKVRVNMVRHLEMHEAEKRSAGSAVPSSCPVNPVPCLNRAEMMFDKMENLAASSQAMLGADSHPAFVPERFRYVCGAPGCHYMGCDEDMLRTHVRTLHAGETDYVCTHCGRAVAVGADLEGVLEHLRMHGGRLYRCTYCAFSHYTVAQVERHVSAKHPNQPVHPVIIRKVVD